MQSFALPLMPMTLEGEVNGKIKVFKAMKIENRLCLQMNKCLIPEGKSGDRFVNPSEINCFFEASYLKSLTCFKPINRLNIISGG